MYLDGDVQYHCNRVGLRMHSAIEEAEKGMSSTFMLIRWVTTDPAFLKLLTGISNDQIFGLWDVLDKTQGD